MCNKKKSIKTKIAIIATPLILLFAYRVKVPLRDKLEYFVESLFTFTPLAFIFAILQRWFDANSLFAISLVGVLVTNGLVGGYFHYKKGTFDLPTFVKKNIEMIAYTFVVYYCLYVLHENIKETFSTNLFLALINVTSLLFPVSKICKNVFILSDGKHPPEFLMTKLYNFQKRGDLQEFFESKKD
ncbi:hypothetical protein [Weeksella sp. HMSC059D05]|uniref:hypothetical protein n=1 Tax=Weeksella sp. HMSC059D05 TaxID=1715139 RepID=UPI0008A408BA|nr:hypothetical protein [Weeksella sp. HMSC059D05]OFM84563.1 hypothetical protein HMPREF2660_08615 [Weeksella sp. HMSC059D05]